ncbi:acetate--CoA ligase [Candidatus Roizmanbacteria bacterium RIFCSPHIGHO2_02_FULL_37_13b]|uniref:acetate--CoA ligase n=1 Tax=Candidatus Roizmanbacteria bacterium RIFCSPLOWO2_02_FULL_36_11 TaxID=1802071 RepID=A0A1F7JHY7_9BACT|nr:MAG: acetate--CoA ligase [Candidatus Roizmanbacteria bacterium RIFCSPHIGHO2_02_FULL_37_13b]OGK55217.1 MAG: acetate--CoA ligase [Candidatus Roizmanbacteria bacterium RIFCSPLOWO2_02_FULL_36_11]
MDTIHKDKYLKSPPNLPDYSKAVEGFHYDKHISELVWFSPRHINAAYNAITKNALSDRKNKVALYYVDENESVNKYTFLDLELSSNKLGNFLKAIGCNRGDRVFIFLPRVPELYISFIGILKIGAIAGTMFSAFGPQAIFDRLSQSEAKFLITNSEMATRLKSIRNKLPNLKRILLIDKGLMTEIDKYSDVLNTTETDMTDDAFMLYTSGTTGKPKGIVHQHKAIIHEYLTAKWVLDIKDSDIYWCTADPGWVTGIAYEILGSWACGSSTVVFPGRFSADGWYRIIEKLKVTVWYTAPTAIRMLASQGLTKVKKYDLSSLRFLASVGEPLNPEPIRWGLKAFNLPFHDNYWQTETGGIVIANYAALPIKPGSMGKPFPGIKPHIIAESGDEVGVNKVGNLTLEPNWPSLMKKVWRRPKKYQSYFLYSKDLKKKLYITGDLAYKDRDGYYWFVGRADDVIKTAGERVGPFEVESALVAHEAVVEAGVIGKPDPMRGEIIKAFVVLKPTFKQSDKLKEELSMFVKKNLAGHAYPREIEFVDHLPKTRSGKIMRRILKAKELGLPIGDTSTLEEY